MTVINLYYAKYNIQSIVENGGADEFQVIHLRGE